MSRAAMQMALDALTRARDSVSNELGGYIPHPSNARVIETITDDLAKVDSAIAALRAALAASDKTADVQTIVDTAAPLPPIDTHPDAQHRYTEAQMRLYWCDGAGYAMARTQEREAPVVEPYAWAVTGLAMPYYGEHAEHHAKLDAKRCGGTARAFPLYTAPAQTDVQRNAADLRRWTLLLTSAQHGLVGEEGHTFRASPEFYERVTVQELPYD